MRRYRIEVQQYFDNIKISSNCAGITFVNNGSLMYINNFPVAAGASLSFEANENELDSTEYNINFAGTIGDLWVFKKLFI